MGAIAASLIAGLMFGAGLAVSGMMNPSLVLAFLDFAGSWNPTLGFVMAGALVAAIPGYAVARRRDKPVLDAEFQIPTRRDIDAPLLVGAALFGVGWGIGGFCPGPALAALGSGMIEVFVFVGAMIAGMLLYRVLPGR